jgi:hypothetical protein
MVWISATGITGHFFLRKINLGRQIRQILIISLKPSVKSRRNVCSFSRWYNYPHSKGILPLYATYFMTEQLVILCGLLIHLI